MLRRLLPLTLLLTASAVVLLLGRQGLDARQAQGFDRLTEADRKELAERFRRDIWPLLEKGGKNGCVGCHMDRKIVSALRMTGDADKDFRIMLRDGFFLPDDPGGVAGRLIDKDRKRVMPPPSKGPRWPEADVKKVRDFVLEIEKRQKP
jgi:hypothetical protein